MGLLHLPTEVRLQIFEHLPDLSYRRRPEIIGPSTRLTPSICRVCRIIRHETLPLYAKTSSFVIQTDDAQRIHRWFQALGDVSLSKVENLQLSKHWELGQPTRWQSHVGFYIHLQLVNQVWVCTGGTYPFANDMRAMRLESVGKLRHIILRKVRPPNAWNEMHRLTPSDVEFIVNAMGIVASYPVPLLDCENSDAAKKQCRKVYEAMERKLLAL